MYRGRLKTTILENPRQPLSLQEYACDNKDIPLKKDWSQRWCTLFATFEDRHALRDILQMQVRPQDVFVVTFIKCGTTWMQEAAWLLLNNLDYEKAKEIRLRERSPFFDYQALLTEAPKIVERCSTLKDPRLMKTHLPANLCPVQMWQKKSKTIYVARNAKDVIVSSYHFCKSIEIWLGLSMEDFVNDFINDDIIYTNFWAHIVEFWQMQNENFIFFTTYEEMKSDLAGVLQKLSKFLELPDLHGDQLKMLLEHLSFDQMKTNKAIDPVYWDKDQVHDVTAEFQFLRRGIVGSYKDELTAELRQKIDDWSAKCLAEYGLTEKDIFGDI